MAWLGFAGMPRRYPDYPDAFIYLNSIITFGSILILFSVLFFLYLIFNSLLSPSLKLNNSSYLYKNII
jgi:heme/copper-type cytochrome/quinol oxidase subunit 1